MIGMSKHDGHKLVYVLDACIAEHEVTITPEGDVTYVPTSRFKITSFGGDSGIWCNDCDEQIHGGENGLSEEWQVV